MLKFQDDYSIQIENMEDLILISYVMIDELYKQYAPQEVTKRKNVSKVKLSDSEIITISICGELAGIDSENGWYNFVKKNYRYLFPDLCCRSKFNRKRRNLLQVTELIREKLFQFFYFLDLHTLFYTPNQTLCQLYDTEYFCNFLLKKTSK